MHMEKNFLTVRRGGEGGKGECDARCLPSPSAGGFRGSVLIGLTADGRLAPLALIRRECHWQWTPDSGLRTPVILSNSGPLSYFRLEHRFKLIHWSLILSNYHSMTSEVRRRRAAQIYFVPRPPQPMYHCCGLSTAFLGWSIVSN